MKFILWLNVGICCQVALMGSGSQYVVSGSDDGHIFVWERATGSLVNLLRTFRLIGEDGAPQPLKMQPAGDSRGDQPFIRTGTAREH